MESEATHSTTGGKGRSYLCRHIGLAAPAAVIGAGGAAALGAEGLGGTEAVHKASAVRLVAPLEVADAMEVLMEVGTPAATLTVCSTLVAQAGAERVMAGVAVGSVVTMEAAVGEVELPSRRAVGTAGRRVAKAPMVPRALGLATTPWSPRRSGSSMRLEASRA